VAYSRLFVECPLIRVNRPCSVVHNHIFKKKEVSRQATVAKLMNLFDTQTIIIIININIK